MKIAKTKAKTLPPPQLPPQDNPQVERAAQDTFRMVKDSFKSLFSGKSSTPTRPEQNSHKCNMV